MQEKLTEKTNAAEVGLSELKKKCNWDLLYKFCLCDEAAPLCFAQMVAQMQTDHNS